jgi:hypothetical protein
MVNVNSFGFADNPWSDVTYDPPFPITSANEAIGNWIDGSLVLRPCWAYNCTSACTDDVEWFRSFTTCALYPAFSDKLSEGFFTSSQEESLNSQGIFAAEADVIDNIRDKIYSCMAEFAFFTPGVSNTKGFSSCTSFPWTPNPINDTIFVERGIDYLEISDCINDAICVYKPSLNTDLSGIGVSARQAQINSSNITRSSHHSPFKAASLLLPFF